MEVLDASYNLISDLCELSECISLKRLNLSHNQIQDIGNIVSLSYLDELEEIDLNENPIQQLPNYSEVLKNTLSNNKIIFEFNNKDKSIEIDISKINNTQNTTKNVDQSNIFC